MKRKIPFKTIASIVILIFLIWILQSQLFHFSSQKIISRETKNVLLNNAATSLKTLDVLIGSVLIYKDEIIGEGFNTVLRDTNLAGHAELNAINDAIKKTGFNAFNKLHRDSLILITTYEPCMMCRGAILENNIQHVLFLKDKGLLHWLKNDVKQFLYEWNKKQTTGELLQDSLFMLHPNFPGREK